jgi:hypothetical protein
VTFNQPLTHTAVHATLLTFIGPAHLIHFCCTTRSKANLLISVYIVLTQAPIPSLPLSHSPSLSLSLSLSLSFSLSLSPSVRSMSLFMQFRFYGRFHRNMWLSKDQGMTRPLNAHLFLNWWQQTLVQPLHHPHKQHSIGGNRPWFNRYTIHTNDTQLVATDLGKPLQHPHKRHTPPFPFLLLRCGVSCKGL